LDALACDLDLDILIILLFGCVRDPKFKIPIARQFNSFDFQFGVGEKKSTVDFSHTVRT
jgi:hypothetical protein